VKTVLAGTLGLLITVAAIPAFACGDKGEASFPMKGADFQQKVDAKIARAKDRLEERLKVSRASAEQAKAARAHVATIVTRMQEATRKAVADGVVTADEAKAVHEIGRELRQHKNKTAASQS
jgi:hypothetical protein